MDNPTHLSCPWCPAQAFPCEVQLRPNLLRYQCPARHTFFIRDDEDTTFDYGYNEQKERGTGK
jgi:hypothetical protein